MNTSQHFLNCLDGVLAPRDGLIVVATGKRSLDARCGDPENVREDLIECLPSSCMNHEFLSGFFEEAARSTPSLLVFKDLHRAFVEEFKDDGTTTIQK